MVSDRSAQAPSSCTYHEGSVVQPAKHPSLSQDVALAISELINQRKLLSRYPFDLVHPDETAVDDDELSKFAAKEVEKTEQRPLGEESKG